jgi:hypothetical protein
MPARARASLTFQRRLPREPRAVQGPARVELADRADDAAGDGRLGGDDNNGGECGADLVLAGRLWLCRLKLRGCADLAGEPEMALVFSRRLGVGFWFCEAPC